MNHRMKSLMLQAENSTRDVWTSFTGVQPRHASEPYIATLWFSHGNGMRSQVHYTDSGLRRRYQVMLSTPQISMPDWWLDWDSTIKWQMSILDMEGIRHHYIKQLEDNNKIRLFKALERERVRREMEGQKVA